jgi:hypothetical protein
MRATEARMSHFLPFADIMRGTRSNIRPWLEPLL